MTFLSMIKSNWVVMTATVAVLGIACNPQKAENASEGKISNVYVLASDSRDVNKLVFLPMVTLIKGTDTLTSAAPDFPSNYLELGKFEKGNYTISFQNIYGQNVSQQFAITGADTDTEPV